MPTGKCDTETEHGNWIGIVLETMFVDGRHRIIEHVLAPYLINVKHFSIDKTTRIIEDWIERCEAYEPMQGNVNAFITRSCYNASKYKRNPKNLKWFKKNYRKLYNVIVSVAKSYGLEIE